MIRICYLTQFNLFSNRAHVYNVTKTCEALASHKDLSVLLVTSYASSQGQEDYFRKHRVKTPFSVISLSSLNRSLKGRARIVFSNIVLIHFLLTKRNRIDVLYFRDHLLVPAVWVAKRLLKKSVIFESHYVLARSHGQFLTESCVKLSDGVVAISGALKERYRGLNDNVVVAYCGAAEKERFDYNVDRNELKKSLGLPLDNTLIGYTGNVGHTGNGDHYRLDLVLKALTFLPEKFIFVGAGEKENDAVWLRHVAERQKISSRVIILPQPERDLVPNFQRAFDVLVLPERELEREGDSPLKMFEYLASGRPIVASDTKVMGEVLHDKKNALLIPGGTPEAWAKGILSLDGNAELEKKITDQALKDADMYTWQERANRIIRLVYSVIPRPS